MWTAPGKIMNIASETVLSKTAKLENPNKNNVLPVQLSEQMDIWLQQQSSPKPNGEYPVI